MTPRLRVAAIPFALGAPGAVALADSRSPYVIGALQGELRAVHLRAHLEQAEILSPERIAAYNRLRGYDAAPGATPEATPTSPHHRGAR